MNTLYIFAGLPGTGKSALAQSLARERRAAYLRIDTIEQALRDSGTFHRGAEGYDLAYRIASDNLRLGLSVVADSVNPIWATRTAWREVALLAAVPFVEIEVICSDESEHQTRVDSRGTDIPGLTLPTWRDVISREHDRWDTEHIVIDTASKAIEESNALLRSVLFNA
jgi:predicted kinase